MYTRAAPSSSQIPHHRGRAFRWKAKNPSDEERFRLLVDSVVDYAIFILDDEGYVRTWNSGAQQSHLAKPFDIAELVIAVAGLVERTANR